MKNRGTFSAQQRVLNIANDFIEKAPDTDPACLLFIDIEDAYGSVILPQLIAFIKEKWKFWTD